MGFSGGVKLGDLDDFLSPSSECIATLIEGVGGGGKIEIGKLDARGPISAPKVEKVEIQKPNLIRTKKSASKDDPKGQIGQVSLSDCLACSGCVTSAETVLLQEQSGEEFMKKASTTPLTVVSISSEARSSLAAHMNASPLVTMQKVAGGLSSLGVTYVLENSASEALALLEGEAEFVERFRSSQKLGQKGNQHSLPLLTSHCPGWTCYAEKVVEPAVIPHLFPLRPPQQIQGRLVKTCLLEAHNRRLFYRWWRARCPLFAGSWLHAGLFNKLFAQTKFQLLTPADVYHVSVQPCFDKKIEAARPHFEAPDVDGVREVDTVLTATELLELLRGPQSENGTVSENISTSLPSCSSDSEIFTDLLLGSLSPSSGSRKAPLICAVQGENAGTGGFVEHVFRAAAAKLFHIPVDSVTFKSKQNEDMREVTLEDPQSHRVLLRFVSAYGFRNIQNIIRRLTKPGADPGKECGDFVEIMACPGGCLNGSGLVAPEKPNGAPLSRSERREHVGMLENLLHSGEGVAVVSPIDHPLMLPLYQYIISRKRAPKPNSNSQQGKLVDLIGSMDVKEFLSASWRSLKVDSEGKATVGASALKW
jgi:iron only hydrogenase large subunit-like protein